MRDTVKPKDVSAILRKREITPTEKRLIKTTMDHLGVKQGRKTPALLKKGGKK